MDAVGVSSHTRPSTELTWTRVGDSTYRAAVPGGWLYRYSDTHREPTMVFVPAPPIYAPAYGAVPPLPSAPQYVRRPTWQEKFGGCNQPAVDPVWQHAYAGNMSEAH